MKTVWKQGRAKDWFAECKGISIRVRVDPDNGHPTEICWYLSGKLTESVPVTCTPEIAKRIALEVVDKRVGADPAWADAAYRHNRDIWKKQ
jgi:hypothetical protein